jgi:hypothetical protein
MIQPLLQKTSFQLQAGDISCHFSVVKEMRHAADIWRMNIVGHGLLP